MSEVASILRDNNIAFTPSGNDYLVRCLNPDHEDKHPSLRIDKIRGIGQCLSCGYKINIFKHFNVFTDGKSARILSLKEKIHNCMAESIGLQLPMGGRPWTEDYRGRSAKTMKKFEAFTHPDFEDRIVFPMRSTSGKIVAFNARALSPGYDKKYKITPSGVTVPMYPGNSKPINGKIVLVEGITDFLNLYDKGLTNVIALLGVTTLHGKNGLNKDKLARLKLSGITKIYLMLDGDDAGRNAMNELQPLLEKENFIVEQIELEDDKDPGEASQWFVDQLILEMNN